jgi:hypothetical protein
MLRRIPALGLAFILAGCEPESTQALHDRLPESYKLFFDANQSYSKRDLESSTLSIKPDGTFEISCAYKGSRPSTNSKGKWKVTPDNDVRFDGFLDCAGVWPQWNVGGVSLMIDKDVILLDPDVNVFYKR